MRTVSLLWCLSAGCAASPLATFTDEPLDTGTNGAAGASGECPPTPEYAVEELGCEELAGALFETVAPFDACDVASDCQPWKANCEDWAEVGCYYLVNSCIDMAVLDRFNEASRFCGLAGYCECGAPPPVECVDHRCTFTYDF